MENREKEGPLGGQVLQGGGGWLGNPLIIMRKHGHEYISEMIYQHL